MINRKPRGEVGLDSLAAMARVAATTRPAVADNQQQMRRMVADLCRLLGDRVVETQVAQLPTPDHSTLPPRVQQTLEALLAGDSEKQIARKLQISPHTVHVYVKRLYRHFSVCSRGELLARFIPKSF